MVYSEKARIVDADEIRDMIDDTDVQNPTIGGLLFIETAGKDGGKSKLFPCYIYAWKEDTQAEEKDGRHPYVFMADIIQFRNGEFGMVQVYIHEKDLGVTKRIWDKPPKASVREEHPFVEAEIQ